MFFLAYLCSFLHIAWGTGDHDWYQNYSRFCSISSALKFRWKSEFLLFLYHSAEQLWIAARFHSACSSAIPSPTLHWQRQTLLLISWTPPLPSYPTGKLKQDRKTYFSLPSLFLSALSSLHRCPRQPRSNSELLTHAPSSRRCLPLRVPAALMCGAWAFYNMFNITPQGPATQTTTLTMQGERERRRDVRRDGTELSAQSKPICLPLPIFAIPPTAYKTRHTQTCPRTLTKKHYIFQFPHYTFHRSWTAHSPRHIHHSPQAMLQLPNQQGWKVETDIQYLGHLCCNTYL